VVGDCGCTFGGGVVVTTTPPPNVQPQSPTTKQAQKEINPKYKDLRSY
jgi:hypothetical protein